MRGAGDVSPTVACCSRSPTRCSARPRTLARSREDYVGEWLPEPLLTSPDVAEDAELAESVPIAMLTVLATTAAALFTGAGAEARR